MQKFLLRHIYIYMYLFLRQKRRNYESYNLQGVYLCTLSFCCCWDRGWGALTHCYSLTSLKRRFCCFMITSVPFSLIFSVIKWSSVKIYVWSAFFHFRQYSYHVTRFVIFFFWCLYNTMAEKVFFPLLFLFKTPA